MSTNTFAVFSAEAFQNTIQAINCQHPSPKGPKGYQKAKKISHTCNADITNCVVRHEIHHDLCLLLVLRTLARVQFVESIQPCQLEQLLREEESCDKVRLR